MRIILCDRLTPSGAAAGEIIVELERRLREQGHQVEQVLLPYHDRRAAAPGQLMAFRLIDLQSWCDRVIAFGAPAHVVTHREKIIWCWNEPASLLPATDNPEQAPAWLRAADAAGFRGARRVFAATPARRDTLRAAGIEADLLIPERAMPERTMDAERHGTPWPAIVETLLDGDDAATSGGV